MPINNRLTNPGRPLTSEFFGGESDTLREIPPEFRAACELRIVEIPLPWDDPLIPLSDPVLASKAEQKVTSERIRRTTYKQVGPVALHEVYTTKDKQVGLRTRTLRFQGDPTSVPGPFSSVEIKDLGNKHFIENFENDGSLFSGATSTKEISDVLPPMFKVALPSFEYASTMTGLITVPQILGAGEWYRSETQTDVFNMRRTTKTRGDISYPVLLAEEKMTADKQVETITYKLDNSLQHLVPTSTMVEGDVQNLGDGTSVMRTGVVPSVFPRTESEASVTDNIPPEFRALSFLQTQSLAGTIPGTITVPPALNVAGGEISRKEEQVDVFNFRRTIVAHDLTVLPRTIISTRTNKAKQVEIVTKILEVDTTTPLTPNEIRDVSFTRLGNGLALEERVTIPSVFDAVKYEVSVPNLIPAEMRAAALLTTTEQTLVGTATPPSLSGGSFAASDTQLDLFTHRTSLTTLGGVTLPVILHGSELTEEFGGGILDVIRTLNNFISLTVDSGLTVVSSTVKNLGNGLGLKETRQLVGAWPVITSQLWDDEMQSYRQEDEETVAPTYFPVSGVGVPGTYYNENVKAIDQWRSKRIRTYRRLPSAPITTFQYAPFKFPGLAPSPNKTDYRRASSMLCKHQIVTYWVFNVGTPTVAVDEIVYDTIVLNSLNGGGTLDQVDDVLHDAGWFGGGYYFGSTSPSYSTYTGWQTIIGTGSWIFTTGSSSVTGTGTAFNTELHVGDVVGRYWGQPGDHWVINSISSATALTLDHAFPISGSGSVIASRSLGGAWIGNSKVIAATVIPTDIPNLWKVQTKSVVMR